MYERAMRTAGIVGIGLLALSVPAAAQDETRVPVVVDDTGCDPVAIEVPSGVVVFEVTNAGGDIGEFEILSGDRVVDEVENIVPGFVVNMVTRLDGGSYETVCYTLVSPRGTLEVIGGAGTQRAAQRRGRRCASCPPRGRLRGLGRRAGDELVTQDVGAFVAAIVAGDLDAARALYAPSRVAWEEIEPIAELFADLDVAIDAREEDFAAGVDDPEFTGFHRIERILWVEGASGDLASLAQQAARGRPRPRGSPRRARHRAARHGSRGRRAHRRGRAVQADGRGGPLLADRPLVDQRQRRRVATDRRHPAARLEQVDPAYLGRGRRRLRVRSTPSSTLPRRWRLRAVR